MGLVDAVGMREMVHHVEVAYCQNICDGEGCFVTVGLGHLEAWVDGAHPGNTHIAVLAGLNSGRRVER